MRSSISSFSLHSPSAVWSIPARFSTPTNRSFWTNLPLKATSSREQERSLTRLAHIWFGDLVTMRWFDDVWLKEVFANFMADKIVGPQFPSINHALGFFLARYPSAYAIDRTKGSNPIRQNLDNLGQASELYGDIIYHK